LLPRTRIKEEDRDSKDDDFISLQYDTDDDIVSMESHDGPPRLLKRNSYCYANFLVQNLLASPPIKKAILDTQIEVYKSMQKGSIEPFMLLSDIMKQLDRSISVERNNSAHSLDELLKMIELFQKAHPADNNSEDKQCDPLEIFEWALNEMRDAGNSEHSLLVEVCSMMGKISSVKWCHSFQVGWGNDSEGASEDVKKDIKIMDRYNLSITHPKARTTLAECLHSRFEQMKSGVDFPSRRYFHNCAFRAEAYDQTRFLSLVGDHNWVLVIQASPTVYVSEINEDNVCTGNHRQVPIPIDQVVILSGAKKTPFTTGCSLPFFQHYLQKIIKR